MNVRDKNIDWYKLEDFKKVIVSRLSQKLPRDFKFSYDDLCSQVDEEYIYLIKNFNPMQGGVSLESYCYKYAGIRAYQHLMEEYNRVENYFRLDIDGPEEDEDYCEKTDRELYKRSLREPEQNQAQKF